MLALVVMEETYTEVLELEFEARVEGDDQPPVPWAAVPNPILESAIHKTKERHIEGDAPPSFSPCFLIQLPCIKLSMPG